MKLFSILKAKNTKEKSQSAKTEETLLKQGREQFRKLVEKGLNIPVALL